MCAHEVLFSCGWCGEKTEEEYDIPLRSTKVDVQAERDRQIGKLQRILLVATNTVKATKRNPPPGEEGQAHEAAHQNGQDRWCQEVQLQARIKAQEHAPATRKRFLIAGSATLELVLITPQNLV